MDNIWCRWCGGKIAIPEFMSCGVGECGINDLSELTYGLVRTDQDLSTRMTTLSRTDQMTDQMTTTVMRAVSTFYTSSSSGPFVYPGHVA